MTTSLPPQRRLRILYVDQTASMSGGELALLSLLIELDKEAFDPVVLLFEDGPLAAKLEGIAEVVILPLDSSVREMRKDAVGGTSSMGLSKAFVLVGYIANLVRTVRSLRPDVIHTNSLKADILGGLAARLLRIPLIWHVRDRIADDYLPHRAVIVFRKLCRILPNYVIANSYATLETLHLPASKPHSVVSSGFDVSAFADAGSGRAPLADAMRTGRVEIGIAGRISPWKGQDVFLRAAALIHAAFPATHFSIIGAALFGEAEHEAKLHALTHELGLESAVTFCGFQEDIAGAIGALDILVHASIIPEPLGQVIAQGMAAGKPVVAARGGGASETVRHGETGWLVPPNEPESLAAAVIHILENPHAAQEVARLGQVAVKDEFDPRVVAERVEQVYRSLQR